MSDEWRLNKLCMATVRLKLKTDVDEVLSCCVVFQMDLMPFVNKAGCECLNESDDCGFENCLNKEPSYLESDCDEQVSAAELNSHPHLNLFCLVQLLTVTLRKGVMSIAKCLNNMRLRTSIISLENFSGS